MKKQVQVTESERLEIARLCSCFRNPTMLLIIEALARKGFASKSNFLILDGITSFTINQNLKYLRRFGFITGSLSADNPYTLNFEKLKSSKRLLDTYCRSVMAAKAKKSSIKDR